MTRTGDVKNQIRSGDAEYLRSHYMDLAQILIALNDAVARAELNHRPLTVNGIISAMEHYETVLVGGGADLDAPAEKPVRATFTAKRVKKLEPFILNSVIGTDRYYCKSCHGRVEKWDPFCRYCGRKFTEDESDEQKDDSGRDVR